MPRFATFLVLFIIALTSVAFMNATHLPQWYDESTAGSNDPVEEFSKIIEQQGIEAFFGSKLSDLMAGKLRLDQDEFNAIMLSSLSVDEQGKSLLAVSQPFRAQIHSDTIELGSVIDLESLSNHSGKLVDGIERLTGLLSTLNREKVYVAVSGVPVSNDGQLALADNLNLKLGKLTVPGTVLNLLGVDLDTIRKQSIKLSYLDIKEIDLSDNMIDMVVRPSF